MPPPTGATNSVNEVSAPLLRFAADADIDGLYKFRPYDGKHRERVNQVLLRNQIYFSSARFFNDPFDPRPRFYYDSIEKFRYEAGRVAQRGVGKDEREARRRNIDRMSKEQVDHLYDGMTRDWYHHLRNDYPIFCMSASRGDILQWAHYANAHRGLCIHFDHKRYPFGAAMGVRYTDDYPLLRIPVTDRGQEAISTMLLRKSSQWTYEKEYRLIRFPPDAGDWSDLKLTWEGTSATLPPKTIMGISLGADMDDEAEATALAMVRDMPNPVPVHKARLHSSRYELEFHQIA